jgi:hypothetical protein
MLLAIIVVVPTTVAVWRYLSWQPDVILRLAAG